MHLHKEHLSNPGIVNNGSEKQEKRDEAGGAGQSRTGQTLTPIGSARNSNSRNSWTDLLEAFRANPPNFEKIKSIIPVYVQHDVCPGENGSTFLHFSCGTGDFNVTQYLIECDEKVPGVHRKLVNAPDAQGCTPLHRAVIRHDVELTRFLFSHGAEPFDDREGKSLFFYLLTEPAPGFLTSADASPTAAIARMLLDHHVNPRVADPRTGLTPLHVAAMAGDAPVIRLLLAHPEMGLVAAGMIDNNGRTPLSHAAEQGQIEAVRAICEAGIAPDEVNRPDKDGWTSLHWAAAFGHLAVLGALLKHFGAIEMPTPRGEMPADLARANQTPPITPTRAPATVVPISPLAASSEEDEETQTRATRETRETREAREAEAEADLKALAVSSQEGGACSTTKDEPPLSPPITATAQDGQPNTNNPQMTLMMLAGLQPGRPPTTRFTSLFAMLQPSLTAALTELCQLQPPPQDPFAWLAAWLVEHNPLTHSKQK
ncbi:hypothetical protein PAPYR_10477 [Paratrimastix pyriformis]|uniref:Ankyrin repeat protein n=1 Tax=Paratrimastix pyriformis TaxID=342808 RepID=A0ABQ8U5Z2_9EUKA|nr:hypothetical protein PAPYR_10477 [Paratrimastix pyriformis]